MAMELVSATAVASVAVLAHAEVGGESAIVLLDSVEDKPLALAQSAEDRSLQ
jgi:hypothetical protein